MNRIFLFVLTACIVMNGSTFSQTGNTGLSFLKIGIGGRALAMGEAYVAAANDPAATFYNPAALSRSADFQILLMHKEWIQDMKTEFIGAAASWGDFRFGLSVNSTNISNLELRIKPGDPLGLFSVHYASIGLSSSYLVDSNLSFGMTGKFLYEKIFVDEASGFAVDLGGKYKSPWNVLIGLAVNNLGKMNPLLYESTKLPVSVRAGVAYPLYISSMDANLLIASDVVSFTGEKKTHFEAPTA